MLGEAPLAHAAEHTASRGGRVFIVCASPCSFESLLAGIIGLAQPGLSPYSVVPQAACGDNPLKPA